MIKVDHWVHPDTVQTDPDFSLLRDRLYRVSHDIQTEEIINQLLVPKSTMVVFQVPHYNPMVGHMGYNKSKH